MFLLAGEVRRGETKQDKTTCFLVRLRSQRPMANSQWPPPLTLTLTPLALEEKVESKCAAAAAAV